MAKVPMRMDDREKIALNLVARKFDPIKAELEAAEYVLAQEVYMALHKKWLPLIEQLPDEALEVDHKIDVNVGGRYLQLCFGPQGATYDAPRERRRIFHAYARSYVVPPAKVRDKLEAWSDQLKVFGEQRTDALRKTLATLKSFRTFDDLIAAWPDAAKFIGDQLVKRDVAPNVPAVLLKDLSAMLDLPPGAD